jgi:hypothetical protein
MKPRKHNYNIVALANDMGTICSILIAVLALFYSACKNPILKRIKARMCSG